jgi:hypothetical protein
MTKLRRRAMSSILWSVGMVGSALACGTPPIEPPPPPAPPVVCCRVVSWFLDPTDLTRQCVVVCYFREDGLPLYQSNPMPLAGSQACACGLSPLPNIPGVSEGGVSFGPAGGADPDCAPLPANVNGYGPFGNDPCSPAAQQVDSFFDVFYTAAGIPRDPTSPRSSSTFSFSGPGIIPPGVTWRVYRKICFPRNVPVSQVVCPPGSLSAIGLFLVSDGQVFAEPSGPGLPPVPFQQFIKSPGQSAFYKVKCLPLTLTAPCDPCVAPPFCSGDANGDATVNFTDISTVLANFGAACP